METPMPQEDSDWRIKPLNFPPHRFARLLVFDAGGAGCVSSLAILRRIMHPWGPYDPDHPEPQHLYPCRHFEMICGSEWGGILAIMLGRLRMVSLTLEVAFYGELSSVLIITDLLRAFKNVSPGLRAKSESTNCI